MSESLVLDPVLGASLLDVIKGFIFVVFILTAICVTVVVLLQEGKGGGLGSAFGGAAADAFGVKAGTVNRFTAWLAATFLGLALLYSGLNAQGDRVRTTPLPLPSDADTAPEEPAATDTDAPKDKPGDAEAPEAPKDAPEAPDVPNAPEAPDAPKAPEDDG